MLTYMHACMYMCLFLKCMHLPGTVISRKKQWECIVDTYGVLVSESASPHRSKHVLRTSADAVTFTYARHVDFQDSLCVNKEIACCRTIEHAHTCIKLIIMKRADIYRCLRKLRGLKRCLPVRVCLSLGWHDACDLQRFKTK